jgi:hypothetical protein
VTNKVVAGDCTFAFSGGGSSVQKTAPLQNTNLGYSGCSYTVQSGDGLTAGTWSVTVSTSDSTGTATSETKTITVN